MMIYLLVVSVLMLVLIWLILENSILIPPRKGLPILMYHKVSDHKTDAITVSKDILKRQFDYIHRKGYHTLSFNDLATIIKMGKPLPRRSLVLTFDDAYQDFVTHALPLLNSNEFKASVFIPVGFMGKTNVWDQGSDPILSADEIKKLANTGNIEFGIHSFLHRSYAELDPAGMEKDLNQCIQTLTYHNIPFVHVLAYPYGKFPKKDPHLKAQMKEIFRISRLQFALRIGNRINRWPLKDPYEVKRIDIRGTDSFYTFKTKLRKGRRKLFS